MLAELYVLTGRDAGKGLTADAGPTIFLGRAATNHIRVRDPSASRVHCRIDVGPEGLVLHDNGSGNGTFVNGIRIKGSRRLEDEDEVQLGETRVKVLLETDADRRRWRRGSTLELVEDVEDSLLDSRSSGDHVPAGGPLPEGESEGEGEDELDLQDDEDASDSTADLARHAAPSGPRPSSRAAAGGSERSRAAVPAIPIVPLEESAIDEAAARPAPPARPAAGAAPRRPDARKPKSTSPVDRLAPVANPDDLADDDEPSRPATGGKLREVLPGYRIEARLGGHSRAGMAVYRAHQVSLDRTVALKVLLAKGATSQRDVDRLVREARAIARLPHPNIVTIHDVIMRGALRVLVMEHVGGGSLSDRLEDGPLGVERLLEVADHVAGALGYAHAHGVVHRNVKPSNVLYAPEVEAYKLCDFGLATEHGGGRAGDTSFLDGPVDALPFVAPELLTSDPVGDARSDVYALGALLYTCAAGRPPFSGASAPLVAAQVLRDLPAPIRGLPEPVWTVIARCLRKSADERYPDGAALRHEVAACRAVASTWGRV